MKLHWALTFLLLSCAIKPLKDSPTAKKEAAIQKSEEIKQETTFRDEIDEMLDRKKDGVVNRESFFGNMSVDGSIGMESVNFNEDIDGQTQIEGKMLGTTIAASGQKNYDEDFNLFAFGRLSFYKDAQFNQTSKVYSTPGVISVGGGAIHQSWHKDIHPLLGIEREEISFVSGDKTIDLSTVNVFDQISGTKGLFWNLLAGFYYDITLWDKIALTEWIIGTSVLGETTNQKGELEKNVRNIKGSFQLKWYLFGDIFLGTRMQMSYIKGNRETIYYNISGLLGLKVF